MAERTVRTFSGPDYCDRCSLVSSEHQPTQFPGTAKRGNRDPWVLFILPCPTAPDIALRRSGVGPRFQMLALAWKRAEEICAIQARYEITYAIQCGVPGLDMTSLPESCHWECRKNVVNVVQDIKPKRVALVGSAANSVLKKQFPTASKVLDLDYVMDRGGVESPEFRTLIVSIRWMLMDIGKKFAPSVQRPQDLRRFEEG